MILPSVRAFVRGCLFLLVTVGLLPLYLLAYPFGRRARRLFALPFFRTCVNLTGLAVHQSGMPNGNGTFYVANHVSYLDIPVLASVTDGMFVAKSEVRHWPLLGLLSRIGRTVFVSRKAATVPKERMAIARNLAKGDSVFLFPEGSSSAGNGVLPFRAGLMSASQADPDLAVCVQPVSIVYGPGTHDRSAMSQDDRDLYAWYGDTELVPHLWRVFSQRRRIAEVLVRFHLPRLSTEFASIRDLTRWAEQTVSDGIRQALDHPRPLPKGTQDCPQELLGELPVPIGEAPVYALR